MPRQMRLRRLQGVAIIIVLLQAVLFGRLFYLQVLHHGEYRDRCLRQVQRQQEVPARRGRLLDRNGKILAFDIEAWDVSVRTSHVRRAGHGYLAAVTGLKRDELRQRLRKRNSYITLAREVSLSPEAVRRLSTMPGVCLDRHNARTYPYGTLAMQYLGFTDKEGAGVSGIEKSYDDKLRGTPGRATILRDESGNTIGRQEESKPVDGLDVVLSLDIDL